MLFLLCFNYTHRKKHNATVLNLNRNSLQKCNYSCPQITPLFLRHKTDHIPDAKGKDNPALPVLSIKEKSPRSQSLPVGGISEGHSFAPAFSQCLNWLFPTPPSTYNLKDLGGKGDHVANHNTRCHKVDIYESAKKLIMFFQTIKNTIGKPPCSCGKEHNGNTNGPKWYLLPPERIENTVWKSPWSCLQARKAGDSEISSGLE